MRFFNGYPGARVRMRLWTANRLASFPGRFEGEGARAGSEARNRWAGVMYILGSENGEIYGWLVAQVVGPVAR